MTEPSITCPRCGFTSHNPSDIIEGYCAQCHDWTRPGTGYRDAWAKAIARNLCPDCGVQGLVIGPRGGASVNLHCAACGSRFNAHGANLFGHVDLRNTFMVDRLPNIGTLPVTQMTEHRLKDDTLIVTDSGVEATCICGWTSGPRFSGSIASMLFRDHQHDPSKPAPPAPIVSFGFWNPHKSYRDDAFPEHACAYCGKPYRGPAVYCSLACAQADA